MFFWFCILSVIGTALIFRSPALDYRLIALGSLLPLLESLFGLRLLLHTLTFDVLLLFGIMLLGRGRRLIQRRLLPIPIGLLSHLILDGTWTEAAVFWWPFMELDALGFFPNSGEFSSWKVSIGLESIGLLFGVWGWKKFAMKSQKNRRALFIEGRLLELRVV
tara:strand:+ start:68 stop:556 length:489 start_codon:yes stop_codon:yes gene_type:complete